MYVLAKTEEVTQPDQSKRLVRTYRHAHLGKELTTYLLRKDNQHSWWTFEDLYAIPFIRTMAANHIVRLYGHGLQLGDITGGTAQIREILKSADPEKLDRAIAKTYELDNLANTLADPVKQCLGLCTLYVLLDDERPDAYVQAEQSVKMTILSLDIEAQTFFLTWWTQVIERSGRVLKSISEIASRLTPQS